MTSDLSHLAGAPELVPARMLNEYTYCPRLCYMEWVQGSSRTARTRWTDGSSTGGSISPPEIFRRGTGRRTERKRTTGSLRGFTHVR